MITRAQMPRQLRNKGGIMTIGGGGYTGIPMGSRTGFGLIDKVKDRFRKLIPNELADIAVKAAPFVAPFNAPVAGLMRGIGRFDQRGSISDAVKQGIATFGFGELAGKIPGTQNYFGKGMKGAKTLAGDIRTKAGSLFQGDPKTPFDGKDRKGFKFIQEGVDAIKEKIPLLENVSDDVAQKLLVGGITSGASALYSYFAGEFEPQQADESYGEYMARRNERIKVQLRQTLDSIYTPLRNPQYAAMTDEQKDNFVNNIVSQTEIEGTPDFQGEAKATGGRVGLMGGTMPTGIMRTNKAGVMERDYRDKGGFVPVGIKEKADDVPAMLSKNEFVFTADAVRGAGNGSIEKGAQKMYDTMKKLEKRVV
jgi:hypothetical protein